MYYSVPHPTADSYPSLSQLCNEIDLSIDAGLLVQAETLEDELTRQDHYHKSNLQKNVRFAYSKYWIGFDSLNVK